MSLGVAELDLDALRGHGFLDDLDVHFARALARIGPEPDARVVLAAAVLSRHVRAGHVCIELETLAHKLPVFESDRGPLALAWPEPRAWIAAVRASVLTGDERADTPLFIDADGRLYLRRYFDHEQNLARAIAERVAQSMPAPAAECLRQSLDRLFGASAVRGASQTSPLPPPPQPQPAKRGSRARATPPNQLALFEPAPPLPAQPQLDPRSAAGEPDWQRSAAEHVQLCAFTVISGGPGTGKTSTVVKVLALLCEQALASAAAPPRTLLLAPTGKAAARLSEAIKRAKQNLACDERVRAAITEEASTIHRALGVGRAGRGFRHDRESPLAADVVIVDEASMVDLSLMARLCDAVPRSARLVLLGDKNQLASVEAGAVLGDICGRGASNTAAAPIAQSIVQLTRSYRYAPESGIRQLADAIEAAEPERALALLRDPALPDVSLHELPIASALPPALFAHALERFAPFLAASSALEKLAALERFRVLCAHRRGPYGQLAVNAALEAALRKSGAIAKASERYAGKPILITENDREARLYNGDVGVLMTAAAEADRIVACFAAGAADVRYVSSARLPPHEAVYAMSVHKSQGSEFDEVTVVLAADLSPVLSRELLYTAITRAKKRVVLWASPQVVTHCIERSVDRASGLRHALWGQ